MKKILSTRKSIFTTILILVLSFSAITPQKASALGPCVLSNASVNPSAIVSGMTVTINYASSNCIDVNINTPMGTSFPSSGNGPNKSVTIPNAWPGSYDIVGDCDAPNGGPACQLITLSVGTLSASGSSSCDASGNSLINLSWPPINGANSYLISKTFTYQQYWSGGTTYTDGPMNTFGVNGGDFSSYTIEPRSATQGGGSTIPGTMNVSVGADFCVRGTTGTAGGTISPSLRQVNNGTTTFAVSPNSGNGISSITGCGGSPGGASASAVTYTTASLTANCTVTAFFAPAGGGADLTSTVSPATVVASGQSVTWPSNTRNIGTSSAGASTTTVEMRYGQQGAGSYAGYSGSLNDPQSTSAVGIGSNTTPTPSIGGYAIVTPFDFWYSVRACADSSGVVIESDETNNCSGWTDVLVTADSGYGGGVCGGSGCMKGTLTPASPSCLISLGQSSCNVTLTWSTTNPQGTSAVTANGMSNVNGNSGSQAFAVPYPSRTFYLYNNAVRLAISNATSSCSSGSWNGSTCSLAPVPVAWITATPTSGLVGSVNPQLSWGASNSPTSCTASGDWSGAKATSGSNVSQGVLNSVRTYTYTIVCANASGSGPSASDSVTVTSASSPDLTILSAVAPSTATTGTPLTFSATITNQGSASTGSGFSNYFEVRNAANGGGSIIASSTVAMGALAASAGGTATSSTVTFGSTGTYSVQACADQLGAITESNEGNNCSAWSNVNVSSSGSAPVVTISASPNPITSGTSSLLTWTTTNSPTSCTASNGWSGAKATASGSTQSTGALFTDTTFSIQCSNSFGSSSVSSVTVVVSGSGGQVDLTAGAPTISTAYAGANTQLAAMGYNNTSNTAGGSNYLYQISTASNGTGTLTSIPSQAISNITANMSISMVYNYYVFPSTGTYSIRLCMDATSVSGPTPTISGGVITESNESNNCGPWGNITVSTAPLPDLTTGPISAGSTTATVNTNWSTSANMSNSGAGPTGSGFNYFFQGSDATNGTGGLFQISTSATNAWAAGASYSVSTPWYQFSSTGTKSVRACADKANASDPGVITETDENNNCGPWIDVVVAAQPQPSATLSASPSTITQGGSTTLTWSSQNTTFCTSDFFGGNGATGGSQVVIPATLPKTYNLSCTNGSVAASAQATVFGPALPKKPIFKEP